MSLYPEIIGKEALCATMKVKEGKILRANGCLFFSVFDLKISTFLWRAHREHTKKFFLSYYNS